jgi:hypothetical protein
MGRNGRRILPKVALVVDSCNSMALTYEALPWEEGLLTKPSIGKAVEIIGTRQKGTET